MLALSAGIFGLAMRFFFALFTEAGFAENLASRCGLEGNEDICVALVADGFVHGSFV